MFNIFKKKKSKVSITEGKTLTNVKTTKDSKKPIKEPKLGKNVFQVEVQPFTNSTDPWYVIRYRTANKGSWKDIHSSDTSYETIKNCSNDRSQIFKDFEVAVMHAKANFNTLEKIKEFEEMHTKKYNERIEELQKITDSKQKSQRIVG
jgi:hypothetical protein